MSKQAQYDRLLKYLMSGKKIDGIKAWNTLGIYRLSARIEELRRIYKVQDRWVKGKNRFGEKTRWKEYFMQRGNYYREF